MLSCVNRLEHFDSPPHFLFSRRFTAVAQTDLKEPLKALGITEMFEPLKANFSKITSMSSLNLT